VEDGGRDRPLVGLLYDPAVADVIDSAGALVDAVEVIPERLWYDFSSAATPRFQRIEAAVATLQERVEGRVVIGHGIGMSLPSAMPLDDALLDQVVAVAAELNFAWYSEHLSMFLTPRGSVPNAQAGLGLPVPTTARFFASW
jgi:uncharacterized protein